MRFTRAILVHGPLVAKKLIHPAERIFLGTGHLLKREGSSFPSTRIINNGVHESGWDNALFSSSMIYTAHCFCPAFEKGRGVLHISV